MDEITITLPQTDWMELVRILIDCGRDIEAAELLTLLYGLDFWEALHRVNGLEIIENGKL